MQQTVRFAYPESIINIVNDLSAVDPDARKTDFKIFLYLSPK